MKFVNEYSRTISKEQSETNADTCNSKKAFKSISEAKWHRNQFSRNDRIYKCVLDHGEVKGPHYHISQSIRY